MGTAGEGVAECICAVGGETCRGAGEGAGAAEGFRATCCIVTAGDVSLLLGLAPSPFLGPVLVDWVKWCRCGHS